MSSEELRILIADDMDHERFVIHSRLKKELHGFADLRIFEADSAEEAVEIFSKNRIDIAVLDIDFSHSRNSKGMSGLQASLEIKREFPNAYTVALSSHESQTIMEEAISEWRVDWYLRRSAISYKQLAFLCKQAMVGRLHEEQKLLGQKYHFYSRSQNVRDLLRQVDHISPEQSVLIYGETGTGKELVSRRIHANAKIYWDNPNRPFKVLDCSSLSEDLFESEVFGHRKGAFTGAIDNKPGALELADGGDLFLDEIHNIPLGLQQKLLRVLNDGVYFSVGDNTEKKAQFRIIAATNIPIEDAKAKGLLLSDFVARIDGVRVHLPALRDRREDIALLAELFLKSKADLDKEFSTKALDFMRNQSWPENIRQLRSVVETAIIEAKIPIISEIVVKDIYLSKIEKRTPDFSATAATQVADPFLEIVERIESLNVSLADGVTEIEKRYIERQSKTVKSFNALAEQLGYSRNKLRLRVQEFGLPISEK